MDDEDAIMVCVYADDPHRLPGYPTNCSECDKPIWVTNSSRELLTVVTKMICMQCYLDSDPDIPDTVEPPDPTQMKELRKYLTQEQIDSIPEKVRKMKRQYEKNKIQLRGGVPGRTDEKSTSDGKDS